MWKIVLDFLGFILLLVILIYMVSGPRKSVFQLFKGNKDDLKLLEDFLTLPVRKVNINKHQWKYLITGKGEDWIIFLHDMGGAYHFWYKQINALKDQYNMLTFTYPPVSGLEELSDGIKYLMKHMGIEKAHFIGTSIGGYVIQYFSSIYPENVKSMVLGNTLPPNDIISKEFRMARKIGPLLPEWLFWKLYRKGLKRRVLIKDGCNKELQALLLEQTYGGMSKNDLVSRYRCVTEKFTVDQDARKMIPTLIIDSENDPMIDESLKKELKQQYPGAQVYTFLSAGHYPFILDPDTYTQKILSFLTSLSQS